MKKVCTKNLVLQIEQGNLCNCLKTSRHACSRWNRGTCEIERKHTHSGRICFLPNIVTLHHQTQTTRPTLQPTRRKSHRSFNPFSKESQDVIKAAGNTELCEIVDVEPKAQCRACLAYWDIGIFYCTCGHFLRDDTAEKQEVHQVRS